jgi:hypothetical protein
MPERLTERAKVLADRVGALSDAVEHLDQRTNRGEKAVIGVVAGLVLSVALSVIVGIVLVKQQTITDQISVTQEREAHTRQDALCPLYSLILGSYNPNSRPEGDARQAYIDQFKVMRQAYDALDCTAPLVPPPTPR